MKTIDELLNHYGLQLSDCNEDWADMVKEFQRVKSAFPPNIREDREAELVALFNDYHEISGDDDSEDKKPPVETKPAPASKGPRGAKSVKPQPYNFDEQSLFDKADKLLDDIL